MCRPCPAQWYDSEVCLYDWARPRFTSQTGHFSQVVWAASERMGCAIGNCPMGSTDALGKQYKGPVVACHYHPRGNLQVGAPSLGARCCRVLAAPMPFAPPVRPLSHAPASSVPLSLLA